MCGSRVCAHRTLGKRVFLFARWFLHLLSTCGVLTLGHVQGLALKRIILIFFYLPLLSSCYSPNFTSKSQRCRG